MTPKEKAKYLFDNFKVHDFDQTYGYVLNVDLTKEMASKVVDEILSAIKNDQADDPESKEMYENYWKHTKSEIEKLQHD